MFISLMIMLLKYECESHAADMRDMMRGWYALPDDAADDHACLTDDACAIASGEG